MELEADSESETFESEESIFKKILRNGCVLEAYIYTFIYIYKYMK